MIICRVPEMCEPIWSHCCYRLLKRRLYDARDVTRRSQERLGYLYICDDRGQLTRASDVRNLHEAVTFCSLKDFKFQASGQPR